MQRRSFKLRETIGTCEIAKLKYSHTTPRSLKTTNGIQHAEWVLLLHDLRRCLELVDLWGYLESLEEKIPRDIRVAESLFRDAVVSFVSCFDKDNGRVYLDEQFLYGSIEGALAAFQWFYNVRNKSIAHRPRASQNGAYSRDD